MSPKHTPGPWHTGGQDDRIIYAADGFAVADATVFHGRPETHNARLIAAAPELLDALKVLLSLHDSQVDTADAWNVSMEEARTAISKATGEPA